MENNVDDNVEYNMEDNVEVCCRHCYFSNLALAENVPMDDTCDCPVCLNPMSLHEDDDSTERAVVVHGNHILGRNCLTRWLKENNNTCPICRAVLFSEDELPFRTEFIPEHALEAGDTYLTTRHEHYCDGVHVITRESSVLPIPKALQGTRVESEIDLEDAEIYIKRYWRRIERARARTRENKRRRKAEMAEQARQQREARALEAERTREVEELQERVRQQTQRVLEAQHALQAHRALQAERALNAGQSLHHERGSQGERVSLADILAEQRLRRAVRDAEASFEDVLADQAADQS